MLAPHPGESPVDYFWGTYYHRIHMMSPGLAKVGANESGDVSVINVAHGEQVTFEEGPWPWKDPATVPCDGATGVKVLAYGELPKEPVDRLDGRGFPLMAVFRARTPAIKNFRVELFDVTANSEPVPLLPADPWQYPRARGAVPAGKLRARTKYRAVFSWEEQGRQVNRVVRFTTE